MRAITATFSGFVEREAMLPRPSKLRIEMIVTKHEALSIELMVAQYFAMMTFDARGTLLARFPSMTKIAEERTA